MDDLARNSDSSPDEASPLVSFVSSKLIQLIEIRRAANLGGLPSERQLATDFEVSRGVVRAALKKLADEGVLHAKANCRPVVRAAVSPSPRQRRNLHIHLWPNTSDFAAASILKGIQQAERPADIRLLVGFSGGEDWDSIYDSEREFLESLATDAEDACAILWYIGGERNLPHLQKLRSLGVPLVFVDRTPPKSFSSDFVGTNNEAGAETAVRHLLGLGHRRIAMISNLDQVSAVRERENGYRRALQAAKITIDPQLIQRDKVDDPVGIQEALEELFRLAEPPTGIFCINDHIALQAYEALQNMGLKVPEAVSVVGFDGMLRWLPGGGYLSTCFQDFERIGRIAGELAIERMKASASLPDRYFYIDAPFVVRNSTSRWQGEARDNNDVRLEERLR